MGLTLIRHTKLKAAGGLCYGRTDLDVASTFNQEADAVLRLAPVAEIIVSSPLTRCQKLANFLAKVHGLSIRTDWRLQEMDFGAWEGKRWSDIPKAELDAWAADFLHARPHGGESVAMLRTRTVEAIAEYHASDNTYLVVTHAGVIKAALSDGDDAEHFSTHVEFGGIVKLPADSAIRNSK